MMCAAIFTRSIEFITPILGQALPHESSPHGPRDHHQQRIPVDA